MGLIEYQLKVQWGDTDAAGIVFYPNFYKWMDQASHHFFSKIGYPSSSLYKEEKIGFPILEAKCVFKSPLFFEDEVVVQSSVKELKEKVFTLGHTFVKDGKTVAEGYEIRAWVRFEENKPKAHPIPDEVRKAMSDTFT